jgi:hypothetical protein
MSESLRSDLESFVAALRASAPASRMLEPIVVADFEAVGDEQRIGVRLAEDLQRRLSGEAMETLAATRSNRLTAASDRLRHRVAKLLETQLPQLASAVRRMHAAADALPTQTIEAVLGSREVLQSAIRERIRSHVMASTSLIWFPYRTMLGLLALTHGAWDRLLMSMSGSLPSIFGSFVAWARNVQQSGKHASEIHEGIRERLNGQIQDRLGPIQGQFYRAVDRLRGHIEEPRSTDSKLRIQLSGVEELQAQASAVFVYTVERFQVSKALLQILGATGAFIFWILMAGPIVSIYRQYLNASYRTIAGGADAIDTFPHPSSALLTTSLLLSVLPVLVYAMIVMSWMQRASRVLWLADLVYSEELKKVDELKRNGVIELHFEDSLLAHAEFLVNIERSSE